MDRFNDLALRQRVRQPVAVGRLAGGLPAGLGGHGDTEVVLGMEALRVVGSKRSSSDASPENDTMFKSGPFLEEIITPFAFTFAVCSGSRNTCRGKSDGEKKKELKGIDASSQEGFLYFFPSAQDAPQRTIPLSRPK